MVVKLREQLLVEKCLNTIIIDYQNNKKDNYVNADVDLKLDFLSFLTSNEKEEVNYGIKHLLNYPQEYKLLTPLILEYQTYGLTGQLECKPIPEKYTNESKEENKNWWQKITSFIKGE